MLVKIKLWTLIEGVDIYKSDDIFYCRRKTYNPGENKVCRAFPGSGIMKTKFDREERSFWLDENKY